MGGEWEENGRGGEGRGGEGKGREWERRVAGRVEGGGGERQEGGKDGG